MAGGRRNGSGRKKGVPNKFNADLKAAILQAATQAGGTLGLVGYLQMQASANPAPFIGLLGKVLPMQLTGDGGKDLVINVTVGGT